MNLEPICVISSSGMRIETVPAGGPQPPRYPELYHDTDSDKLMYRDTQNTEWREATMDDIRFIQLEVMPKRQVNPKDQIHIVHGLSFVEGCSIGLYSVQHIDAFVDAWHMNLVGQDLPLRSALGLGIGDYILWTTNPNHIYTVIHSRMVELGLATVKDKPEDIIR